VSGRSKDRRLPTCFRPASSQRPCQGQSRTRHPCQPSQAQNCPFGKRNKKNLRINIKIKKTKPLRLCRLCRWRNGSRDRFRVLGTMPTVVYLCLFVCFKPKKLERTKKRSGFVRLFCFFSKCREARESSNYQRHLLGLFR
jgi:hypothetical protein